MVPVLKTKFNIKKMVVNLSSQFNETLEEKNSYKGPYKII